MTNADAEPAREERILQGIALPVAGNMPETAICRVGVLADGDKVEV
jgi:hypothetical protein